MIKLRDEFGHPRNDFMTRGRIWYIKIVGFIAKRLTSGFEVSAGSGKVSQAILPRVKLYDTHMLER